MGGTVSVCGDLKAKGNEHFKEGRFSEAAEAYTLVYFPILLSLFEHLLYHWSAYVTIRALSTMPGIGC